MDQPPEIEDKIISMSYDKDTQKKMTRTGGKQSKDRNTFRGVVDHVFNTTTNQRAVFKVIGIPLISAALGGFNATLFAYGQTGSGINYVSYRSIKF